MPPKPAQYCWRCEGICTGTCQQEASRQYDRDRNNDPFHLVYKTARWIALALRIRKRDPLCKVCGNKATRIVDHVVPARLWVARGNDFWDETNLQGLCVGCHNAKTRREAARSAV